MIKFLSKVSLQQKSAYLIAIYLVIILLNYLTSNFTNSPTLCPFRLLTGLPCPGCGLTRSIGVLAQGNLQLSLNFHPLGIVIVFIALLIMFFPIRFQKIVEEITKLSLKIKLSLSLNLLIILWIWNFLRWDN
jgi:hypothetical protein